MQNLNNAKLFVCFPRKNTENFENEIAQDLGKALTNSVQAGNYTNAATLVSNIANTISGTEQKSVKQLITSSGIDASAAKEQPPSNTTTALLASLIPK